MRWLGLLLVVVGVGAAVYMFAIYDVTVALPAVTVNGEVYQSDRDVSTTRVELREESIGGGLALMLAGLGVLYWDWRARTIGTERS